MMCLCREKKNAKRKARQTYDPRPGVEIKIDYKIIIYVNNL